MKATIITAIIAVSFLWLVFAIFGTNKAEADIKAREARGEAIQQPEPISEAEQSNYNFRVELAVQLLAYDVTQAAMCSCGGYSEEMYEGYCVSYPADIPSRLLKVAEALGTSREEVAASIERSAAYEAENTPAHVFVFE